MRMGSTWCGICPMKSHCQAWRCFCGDKIINHCPGDWTGGTGLEILCVPLGMSWEGVIGGIQEASLDYYPLTAPSPGGSPGTAFQPRASGAAPSLGVPRNSSCTGHWRAIMAVCSLPKPSPHLPLPGAWAASRACLPWQGCPAGLSKGAYSAPCTCLCP